MLKSMTAYGRSIVASSLGRFTIEIQSVNRKHLEINTLIPNEFLRFDTDIKKWISEAVGRGQVNVKVFVAFENDGPLKAIPNIPLGKQVTAAWRELADVLKFSFDEKDLFRALADTRDILLFDQDLHDEEAYKKVLKQAIDEALKQLVSMKNKEGEVLKGDISRRIEILMTAIKQIAEKAPQATTRYREKLKEKLEEVLAGSLENEERLLREVCVFADKTDITEEIVRFDSHLVQLRLLLNAKNQSVGKTLEFMIQELNREINTIGAKSSDVDVSRLVIEIKTELERIREQIQNIE